MLHHAVGLNYIDVYQRTGLYPNTRPLALGMEGAGVIEAVGEGVTHLKVGDRAAYAANPPGSYCDVRVMPAMNVCQLPDAIDFETGAAMMLKGLTAQYLLKRCKPVEGLEPGDFVLFHAAAGGVGLIACQWAKALGLRLIGTAGSDEKCALAREHGAEFTINYRTEDFVARVKEITGGLGVDYSFDAVSNDKTQALAFDALAPGGHAVAVGISAATVRPIRRTRRLVPPMPVRLAPQGQPQNHLLPGLPSLGQPTICALWHLYWVGSGCASVRPSSSMRVWPCASRRSTRGCSHGAAQASRLARSVRSSPAPPVRPPISSMPSWSAAKPAGIGPMGLVMRSARPSAGCGAG